MAKRLQYFSNSLGLLPANQYGGRERSSVLDAGASLIQEIQEAWTHGKVVTVLACDVQGFFDNVGHPHLLAALRRLRLPLPLQKWVASFISDRSIAVSFDGFCGPFAPKPDHGVPQGSPVSPILAELFASSALTLFSSTADQVHLRAYVDDHLLSTSSKSVGQNIRVLQRAYTRLQEYLQSIGLGLDSAKTECMHFSRNPRIKLQLSAPIFLKDAEGPGRHFICRPSTPLRWLGLWLDPGLRWTQHVERMANKGASALLALSLLGNTTRGMTSSHLRILYLGCVIPILTWGAELWYSGINDTTRLARLERVEYKGLLRVAGAWRPNRMKIDWVDVNLWACHCATSASPPMSGPADFLPC